MNRTRCCEARGTDSGAGPARRWVKATGSVLPGVIAILLPKCPLCLAAWIAAGTGVALPAIVAASVRPALGVFCVVLALSVAVMRRHHSKPQKE